MMDSKTPTLHISEIKCSYCGDHTRHKDQYDCAICEDCHWHNVQVANEIYARESNLRSQNYFGLPDMVYSPEFLPVKKGGIVKQRGGAFLVL